MSEIVFDGLTSNKTQMLLTEVSIVLRHKLNFVVGEAGGGEGG